MRTRELILQELEAVAAALEGDRPNVVFVGGTVAALYDDDPLDIRPTDVVDVIGEASAAGYHALLDRLKARGFRKCTDEGAPVCRYTTPTKQRVDVMPVEPSTVGFANKWYPGAFKEARPYLLPNQNLVRALTPIFFVATKLEAFHSRGQGDFRASHDIEDVISVLGRSPGLRAEIEAAESRVAAFVRDELVGYAADDGFIDAVPACFIGSDVAHERARRVTEFLLALHA